MSDTSSKENENKKPESYNLTIKEQLEKFRRHQYKLLELI